MPHRRTPHPRPVVRHSGALSRLTAVVGVTLVLVVLTTLTTGVPAEAGATARVFGVSEPNAPADMSGVTALASRLGRAPNLVMWYVQWASQPDFPASAAANVVATGARPVITWEPWDPAAGASQPDYRLSEIASGRYDAYIQRWATQIKQFKRTVTLRFAHEMNGSWYPWAEQANGNVPGDYVRAFRHVRDVFSAQRTGNVVWEWSPNVSFPGSTPLAGLYPGDGYVDEVALDGYNWSTLLAGTQWTSFWDVFAPTVGEVKGLTTRPVLVGETASTEVGGDKAQWVTDLFTTLAAHPEIAGFTWFDHVKETDWRITSSSASADAFRAGLAGYR